MDSNSRGAARPALLIDFAGLSGRRRFTNPVESLEARSAAQIPELLARVDQATRQDGLYAVGFLSYEAAPAFDRAHRVRAGGRLPLAWFGLFDNFQMEVASAPGVMASPSDWRLDIDRAEFNASVAAIREHIAAGTVYQVNLTARQRAQFRGDTRAWYEQLRRTQGPGYHALLQLDEFDLLSISPELFFQRRGAAVITRPMKGTRRRGRWVEEDDALASELLDSAKDRAELLMIVDLVRNDLGRIARHDTVQVRELYDLERYPTVWQMTSTIAGEVSADVSLAEVFGALFPCGSVTGAPKISALEIIAGLEQSPREVYCGAIGLVEPGGDCTFNVPIRTAWIDRQGQAEYGVGGGITWDSAPEAEFDELRAKSVVLTESWPEFELLETMLLRDGAVRRLPLHLDRLCASAAYFGLECERDQLRFAVERAAAAHPDGAWRLRLLAGRAAEPRIDAYPLESAPSTVAMVKWATHAVDSSNRFLYHKTTHRAVYQPALAELEDCFDVLLYNERGEATEFTRGNLAVELGGERLTPPVPSGLLGGVLRRSELEAGALSERVIKRADLTSATRIWLINSVREWVEVRLAH